MDDGVVRTTETLDARLEIRLPAARKAEYIEAAERAGVKPAEWCRRYLDLGLLADRANQVPVEERGFSLGAPVVVRVKPSPEVLATKPDPKPARSIDFRGPDPKPQRGGKK